MLKICTSIPLLIKHSAEENDIAIFGLFFPLIILICWLATSNPWKEWKRETSKDSTFDGLNKFRYFAALILISTATVVGVYKGICYFCFD